MRKLGMRNVVVKELVKSELTWSVGLLVGVDVGLCDGVFVGIGVVGGFVG